VKLVLYLDRRAGAGISGKKLKVLFRLIQNPLRLSWLKKICSDPAILSKNLCVLCIVHGKKVFAINCGPCIIGFMSKNYTIRSSQKAIFGLDMLLLRRKAQ